ncbi:PIH1 domain-containing protein 1-like [Pseudomyrmex gracilis]|uniref:PIH1 domain-containing protein 1-like n=1 Tax=Pseudomyrmex gracilis TaxID=219809 RepID=UPI000994B456|nr:PIH1 domain-containing protein 1-like [Pseudomyrmex gracilis]
MAYELTASDPRAMCAPNQNKPSLLFLQENENEKSDIEQKMEDLMQHLENPCLIVTPTPGICVKARTISNEKIFVNVCISDKIPPPKDLSDAELLKIIDNENTNYMIPLSIGAERMEMSKSSTPTPTYDVMINSAYFKKCKEKPQFMAFTILIILSGVANKFEKEISTDDFIILKNRKVIGKLQQHRIENRKVRNHPQVPKPLIEEMSTKSLSQDENTKLKFLILKEPQKGPAERLIVLFDMLKSVLVEDVVVLVNSDRINVTNEKACRSSDVFLPYTVKADTARAFLDFNMRVLRVDVSVEPK